MTARRLRDPSRQHCLAHDALRADRGRGAVAGDPSRDAGRCASRETSRRPLPAGAGTRAAGGRHHRGAPASSSGSQLPEDASHIGAAQHDGHLRRPLRAEEAVEPRQIDVEHVAVEEEQGAQCLVPSPRPHSTSTGAVDHGTGCNVGSRRRRPARSGGSCAASGARCARDRAGGGGPTRTPAAARRRRTRRRWPDQACEEVNYPAKWRASMVVTESCRSRTLASQVGCARDAGGSGAVTGGRNGRARPA
jgi:hypothetical protein